MSNRSSSGLELDPVKQKSDIGKCSATCITAELFTALAVVNITFQINDDSQFSEGDRHLQIIVAMKIKSGTMLTPEKGKRMQNLVTMILPVAAPHIGKI